MEHMQIRMATIDDLDAITSVEADCFPPAEAATKEEFARRIKAYGTHFWLLCEKGYEGEKLIAFVDGMVTDKKDLTDEMYKKAEELLFNGGCALCPVVNETSHAFRYSYIKNASTLSFTTMGLKKVYTSGR